MVPTTFLACNWTSKPTNVQRIHKKKYTSILNERGSHFSLLSLLLLLPLLLYDTVGLFHITFMKKKKGKRSDTRVV